MQGCRATGGNMYGAECMPSVVLRGRKGSWWCKGSQTLLQCKQMMYVCERYVVVFDDTERHTHVCVSASRRSFHLCVQLQAHPLGPLHRGWGMSMWGCGNLSALAWGNWCWQVNTPECRLCVRYIQQCVVYLPHPRGKILNGGCAPHAVRSNNSHCCSCHMAGKRAVWKGPLYTDTNIPPQFRPEGFEPTWCSDFQLLLSMRS